MLARAQAESKLAEADLSSELRLAEADGIRAVMSAEAEGQAKRAEALNQLSDQAARQNVLPQLIEILPQRAEAIAKGVSIEKMVVIDSGQGGAGAGQNGGAIKRAIAVTPAMLNQVFDLSGLFGNVGISSDDAPAAAGNGAVSSGAASQR